MIEFDPHSKSLQDDPYPTYRRMRDEAPVMYVPDLNFWGEISIELVDQFIPTRAET